MMAMTMTKTTMRRRSALTVRGGCPGLTLTANFSRGIKGERLRDVESPNDAIAGEIILSSVERKWGFRIEAAGRIEADRIDAAGRIETGRIDAAGCISFLF